VISFYLLSQFVDNILIIIMICIINDAYCYLEEECRYYYLY